MASPGTFARLEESLAAAVRGQGADPGAGLLERPKDAGRGDYATGAALRLAKTLKQNPRAIAEELAETLAAHEDVEAAEVAGPGFVNLRLTPAARCAVVDAALAAGDSFGTQEASGRKVLLEFVSSNPTGPLHVGHGRAAALGDSLARILRAAGDQVATEYYLNDRGLQTDVLAASLWLRAVPGLQGEEKPLPAGAYQGDYMKEVAAAWRRRHPGGTLPEPPWLEFAWPDDREAGARLAEIARRELGEDFEALRKYAVEALGAMIETELRGFNVAFDRWFSERELATSGAIEAAIKKLEEGGHVYEKDGAKWFRSAAFGDDKDRVLVRANGELTYFAADVAYHADKAGRGADLLLALFGADHHGYVPRLRAAFEALGHDPAKLEFDIIQFVALVNAGDRIKMSTRAGSFALLADLIAAIGPDAARLHYVLARGDVHMDFDVGRAASRSNDNPVHYIQYAHARGCSLLAKWGGRVEELPAADPAHLGDERAAKVLAELNWYEPTLRQAARQREPHRVAHWLIALAGALHGYYDHVPVLGGDEAGLPARLALVAATRQALACGLALLGAGAPTKM
ncbi:MAG: arginine--tRNA ligase [Betaproteobacteria bacterium AqS2]|uniref:Arginine--tRNA ligase n=1 Tax=Candidatus Amphirhobacter heronislandensis TaxID=1732024 RepID=A0A930UIE8_9GAMM|nr:arginine--tRNA ligase [Betaproteobacteria bacterium AqS2]